MGRQGKQVAPFCSGWLPPLLRQQDVSKRNEGMGASHSRELPQLQSLSLHPLCILRQLIMEGPAGVLAMTLRVAHCSLQVMGQHPQSCYKVADNVLPLPGFVNSCIGTFHLNLDSTQETWPAQECVMFCMAARLDKPHGSGFTGKWAEKFQL